MPIFHFHLRTAAGLERDDTGLTLPDLEAARLDLCRGLPRLLADLIAEGHDPACCAFEIADAEGRPLMQVPLLECRPGQKPRPPVPASPRIAPPFFEAVAGAWDEACLSRSAEALARSYALLRLPVEYPWLRYGAPSPAGTA